MQVKKGIPQLPQFILANIKLEKIDLPLDKVAEIAWKFVTQPNPVIVCQPETSAFDNDLHRKCFGHWEEGQADSRKLIYARPVVFRSYHGVVMSRALVGN